MVITNEQVAIWEKSVREYLTERFEEEQIFLETVLGQKSNGGNG